MVNKLIVGLGNPGNRYLRSRHNIGYMFVDFLKKTKTDFSLTLTKSTTYMNLSGLFIKQLSSNRKAISEDRELFWESLIVCTDDLEQKVGSWKLKVDGGHRGHNGIRSIIAENKKTDFKRLLIGIGYFRRKTIREGS